MKVSLLYLDYNIQYICYFTLLQVTLYTVNKLGPLEVGWCGKK
jgi:hypothetical protein